MHTVHVSLNEDSRVSGEASCTDYCSLLVASWPGWLARAKLCAYIFGLHPHGRVMYSTALISQLHDVFTIEGRAQILWFLHNIPCTVQC
jgi:hypothetical protein